MFERNNDLFSNRIKLLNYEDNIQIDYIDDELALDLWNLIQINLFKKYFNLDYNFLDNRSIDASEHTFFQKLWINIIKRDIKQINYINNGDLKLKLKMYFGDMSYNKNMILLNLL